MSPSRRHPPAAILGACLALAACSSHDTRTTDRTNVDSAMSPLAKKLASVDTANPFRSTGHTYGPPTGKIRVANLLELNGKPSGPLDFYDVLRPDSTSTPIIKHLAFGQISDYVSPRSGGGGSPSNLYVFQEDQKTGTEPFGNRVDNSGFQSTDQLTIVLMPTPMGGPQGGIGGFSIDEAGKRLNDVVSSSEASVQKGGGLLIARKANDLMEALPEQYLTIDGACPRPTYAGSVMLHPISPGTHTLGVVTSPKGKVLQNCDGQTPVSTTSVNVSAGQRIDVFMYGLPSDGIKVMAAPVAGP